MGRQWQRPDEGRRWVGRRQQGNVYMAIDEAGNRVDSTSRQTTGLQERAELLYEHEALYLVAGGEETKLPERANLGVSVQNKGKVKLMMCS